jgi:hypothetical protein
MRNSIATPLRSRGFALVVTLSLMILLTLIAVGLLSLSAVSMRSSAQAKAQAEARANARLALMLALGDLQKQMGPDQRVSANGAIVAQTTVKNPHWTGVWDSWKAGATKSGGDTLSEHSTIAGSPNTGMAPTYDAQRKDHFRSWLLSLNPSEALDPLSPSKLTVADNQNPDKYFYPDYSESDKTKDAVWLVRDGSLGSSTSKRIDYVAARLLRIKSPAGTTTTGRYGWWVGDESQKARIMDDSYLSTVPANTAEKIFRSQAPGSTGTKTIKGLESMTDDRQLAGLPSLKSLDLVSGATGKPAENFHSATPFSYQVLSDVREGGLKRDLSTLLERPITLNETGDDFMLYKFTTKDQWMSGPDNQEAVPIQDLAAYYQLYDSSRSGWKEGIRYTSNLLSNGMQVVSPDYGDGNDEAFARHYTSLYRQPMPIKVQFLLSLFAEPTGAAPTPQNPSPDTHLLRVGITPSLTLWNPCNVPLVMNFNDGNPQRYAQLMRMGMMPIRIKWLKNSTQYTSDPQHMTWYAYGAGGDKGHTFNLYFSGRRSIRFEPGEVKTFSLPYSGDVSGVKQAGSGHINSYKTEFLFKTDKFYEGHEVVGGWEPRSFMLFNRSCPSTSQNSNIHVKNNKLSFKTGDTISFEITADNTDLPRNDGYSGAPFYFHFIQSNHQSYSQYGGTQKWGFKHYAFDSRNGTGPTQTSFNQSFATKGFPREAVKITSGNRSGSNIITRANTQEGWPFMQFSLQAGVETHEKSNGGIAGGRKFASRPFLHSSALAPPFIDDYSGNALYNSGWNWSFDEINEVFEAPVQTNPQNLQQGYYGGGYTQEFGTTNLVQQEIPAAPPISIAALSHARLGGFSIANEVNPGSQTHQVVSANGQAGLFPHTLQAIGNSYAHPLLAANKAYDTFDRTFDSTQGARQVTLADHSYLANKALWDEFFFSSITPQPSSVKTFGGVNRTAKQIASDFFFNEKPLPNRLITPFKRNLDQSRLDGLFATASNFRGGLADQIAAYLMMEGPFNINSTSVDAWKTLLTSLKGKPVAYLDKSKALNGVINPDQATPGGTPVASFSMPNARPVDGSNDPQDPEQWLSWRELNDTEIDQLSAAIVKQVKLRGPFLSLSEFVNRRLDSGNPALSAKGALQAALDDPAVPINEGFRNATRQLGAETGTMVNVFREALEGPVAYGSAAYVDQADILRNFASQLTPRGDTFVIRTYGDSLDSSGNVVARAWCEAVVQRAPEYSDPANQPHIKQADLTPANKTFGRKLEIVSFRWLNPNEV